MQVIDQDKNIKDWQIFNNFSSEPTKLSLNLLLISLQEANYNFIDLSNIIHMLETYVQVLKIAQRLKELSITFNNSIYNYSAGWKIKNCTTLFNSLDEVEKALQNKAFL